MFKNVQRHTHVYNLGNLTRRIERQLKAFKWQGRERRILKTYPIHVKSGEGEKKKKVKKNDDKQK